MRAGNMSSVNEDERATPSTQYTLHSDSIFTSNRQSVLAYIGEITMAGQSDDEPCIHLMVIVFLIPIVSPSWLITETASPFTRKD